MSDAALLALLEVYKSSVGDKDLGSLMAIYADDFRAFDTWDVWLYDGLAEWRKMNETWLRSLGDDRDVVEFSEVKTHVVQDVGSLSAVIRYSATAPDGTVLRSMQNRLTWVARKAEGGWQVIHQHTSVPIDNRTLAGILEP